MNHKKLVILSIFLFIKIALYAQNNTTEDYIILRTGDTIVGTIKHIDESGISSKYYKKIRVINARDRQKKYKRKDVSKFKSNGYTYEAFWLNQSSDKIVLFNPRYYIDSQEGELHFLKIITEGALNHYELEWFEQGESGINWMDLLKKEDDQFLLRASQGLFGLKRKVLKNYFRDCPKLIEQINNKQLNNVAAVVDFYNNQCGK